MKRQVACRLDGSDVVQTTSVFTDSGELHSKDTIRLGDRDTVLCQIEVELANAKADRDGITSPKTSEPAPAGDGKPGPDAVYWISGKNVYKVEILRNAAGKVTMEKTSLLGVWKDRMENAGERFKEISTLRDAIASAK